MLLRLRHLWDQLRFSYWFVPSLMTLGAVGLAALTLVLDTREGLTWAEWVPWLFMDQPDGARTLLSTIAGSMITVAGVTFSITIAALAYATSQFGPRLLTNFMQDRGNQVTLGTFIATYLYSLLILRSIRAGDEATPGPSSSGSDALGDGGSEQAKVAAEAAAQAAGANAETAEAAAEAISAFVPHLSILTALVLAVGSLGVLIYYIHHAPASIHASNVAAKIGRELIDKLGQLFPEGVGADLHETRQSPEASRAHVEPATEGGAALGTAADLDAEAHPSEYEPEPDAALPPRFHEEAVLVRGGTDGYLQQIDGARLVALAQEHDVLLRLHAHPGVFAWHGRPLAAIWPPQNVDDALLTGLAEAFVWGRKRSVTQDVMFLVDELVEVAARALSPGINDPVTAMTCVDWLSAAAARLGQRPMPSAYRYDPSGTLRIVATPITYAAFTEAAFGRLRPYFEADENAALHLMRRYAELAGSARTRRQAVLQQHADALLDGTRTQLHHALALDAIAQAHRKVGRAALLGERG